MKRIFATFAVLLFWISGASAILPGPLKDFFTPRPGDTTAVIFGTRELEKGLVAKLELLAHRNADYLKQKDPSRVVQVYADTAFPKELFGRRSLVLMGSPESNSQLTEWRSFFPFILRNSRLNISGRKLYLGEDVTLVSIFPNPMNNDRYVVLLLGLQPWAQPALSDWPGEYDYYVAQRNTFFGWYLNRGKFEKSASPWSQELNSYERSPQDTTSLVALVYPRGMVWYPERWEDDSLWEVPLRDRIKMLGAVQEMVNFFERSLNLQIRGDVDFQLSDRYPAPVAADPMGRVFLRAYPTQMDSLVFLGWGQPLTRVLFPCRDAPLDWELFGHRYLLTQSFFQYAHKRPQEISSLSQGKKWAEDLTENDSTYLGLLVQLVDAGYANRVGEVLDSVTERGRKYEFQMRDFASVLGRIVKDTAVQRLARTPLHASPYDRQPALDLGIKNLGDLFLNREIVLGDLPAKTPAAVAGLRRGDKIISVDGHPVARNRSRAYLVWLAKKKGESLKLQIDRKGVKRELIIPLV